MANYKRKQITSTMSPMDIKFLNDNFQNIWLMLNGNLSQLNLKEDIGKFIDIKDNVVTINTNGLISNVQSEQTNMKSQINQQANKITLLVSDVSTANSNASYAISQINVLSNEIDSKVDVNGVYSLIRQSSSDVQYAFNNISPSVTINSSGINVYGGTIKAECITGGQLSGVNIQSGGESAFHQGVTIGGDLLVKGTTGGFSNNVIVDGALSVYGDKKCIQITKSYGDRGLYAYETAESFLGDIGEAIIDETKQVTINIDPIMLEIINCNTNYHVFTSVYEGSISKIERFVDKFIVYGEPNTNFSWEIKGKRRGFENVRLEQVTKTEV